MVATLASPGSSEPSELRACLSRRPTRRYGKSDLSNIIKRSKDEGIEKLLTISTSVESFQKIKKIINEDEIIFGTIGIHPHDI